MPKVRICVHRRSILGYIVYKITYWIGIEPNMNMFGTSNKAYNIVRVGSDENCLTVIGSRLQAEDCGFVSTIQANAGTVS
jgi:hypothetical protein